MANPFDQSTFPGKAVGKGNAQVIQDSFDPGSTPPVNVSDPSNVMPVNPVTGPSVDPATSLPTIPATDVLADSGMTVADFHGQIPVDVLDILF